MSAIMVKAAGKPSFIGVLPFLNWHEHDPRNQFPLFADQIRAVAPRDRQGKRGLQMKLSSCSWHISEKLVLAALQSLAQIARFL
jgi:hypothetical protein